MKRTIQVRAVRREPIDIERVARALLALARDRSARQAEQDAPPPPEEVRHEA